MQWSMSRSLSIDSELTMMAWHLTSFQESSVMMTKSRPLICLGAAGTDFEGVQLYCSSAWTLASEKFSASSTSAKSLPLINSGLLSTEVVLLWSSRRLCSSTQEVLDSIAVFPSLSILGSEDYPGSIWCWIMIRESCSFDSRNISKH